MAGQLAGEASEVEAALCWSGRCTGRARQGCMGARRRVPQRAASCDELHANSVLVARLDDLAAQVHQPAGQGPARRMDRCAKGCSR